MQHSNKLKTYKGLFISNQEIGHNAFKIERLKEEFNKVGIKMDIVFNDGTLFEIKDNKTVFHFPKADFIIYLDKDKYLATLLKRANYIVLNDASFLKLCDDKMLSYTYLVDSGIPVVDTIASPLVYHHLVDENCAFLDVVASRLGLPFIIKKVYGSLGEGVYLAYDLKQAKEIYKKIYMHPLVFQSFIDASSGKSLRVLVVDKKILGAILRINDIDFRSNAPRGTRSEKYELDEKQIEIVNKIIDLFDIDYAGLDFVFNRDGEIKLLEMNANAFFEQFEKTTNINVASSIVQMILKRLEKDEK